MGPGLVAFRDAWARAVDPTLQGDQTTAIVSSVLYRSCAIPVAWHIRRATQRGSGMDPTVALLQELAPAVPRDLTVIVLCDRGIASPKLWQQIRAQGWHPGMRYRQNITFCADGGPRLPAQRFASRPDTAWIGRGAAFSSPTAQRRCTRLVVWYVEAGRTLDHPHRPCTRPGGTQLVRPGAAGSGWASRPSRAWAGSGTRPGAPPSPHLPPRAGAVGGDPAGPGRRHQGGRRPGPQRRPRRWLPITATLGASRPPRTVSVIRHGIDWLRRLLLKGRLWSRVCLNPGRNPSPTWRSHTMRRPENPSHTPVSGSAPGVGVAVCPQPNWTAWSWASSASASTCSA